MVGASPPAVKSSLRVKKRVIRWGGVLAFGIDDAVVAVPVGGGADTVSAAAASAAVEDVEEGKSEEENNPPQPSSSSVRASR